MIENQDLKEGKPTITPPERGRFLGLPRTGTGWWAVGLAAASLLIPLAIMLVNVVNSARNSEGRGINLLGMPVLLLALAGGVTGLVAVTRKHERSWLVWSCILLGAGAVVLMIGDLLKALLG